MQALRYRPSAFFRLDDTAPYQDYSGYNISGVATGSAVSKGIALSSDATYSAIFTSTQYMTATVPGIYERGQETKDFTLSAIVYMPAPGKDRIISKAGQFDGLWMDNGVINFGTQYLTTGMATASYTPLENRKFNIVGVHTANKNSLYVNGELVDEVDINEAQRADQYFIAETDKTFVTGLGNVSILVNNVGFFPRAFKSEEVQEMYEADNRHPDGDAAKGLGGEVIPLGTSMRTPYLNTGWYTDSEWETGQMFQVEPEDGVLYAAEVDDVTLAGVWTSSINVWSGDTAVPINSMNLWWESRNATVEVSTDSTTWTAVTKGVKLATYTTNQTPTNDTLFIRVTFAAGQEEAWIRNLRVHAYTGNTVAYNTDRTITYPDASVPYDDTSEPLDLESDWGVNLGGGQVSISNTVSADYPKTVEIWYKRAGTLPVSANLSTGTTIYTNGTTPTADRINEWFVRHYVNASGIAGNLNVSGNGTIGHIALYPDALTATQVAQVVANYTGYTKTVATSAGTDTVAIAESPTAWQAYSHDWEIQKS